MNLRDLRDMDKDDLLRVVGLQTKQSGGDWILPTLGVFSLGLLVGAGVALLLAPKSGRELREDVRNRVQGSEEDRKGALSGSAGLGDRPSRAL